MATAGILTQNLVLQKSKVDDIRRVSKLNVCAAQLQDIGILRQASGLEVLSLSLNDIAEIGAISNCRYLRELYLRNNQIRDINQVLHLSRLPGLEVLNLSDNPIARDPNYRRFVIAAIPSLERLDDVKITDGERDDALRIFPELIYFAPPPSRYAEPREGAQAPAQLAGGASQTVRQGGGAPGGGAARRHSGITNRPRRGSANRRRSASVNRSHRFGHRESHDRRESSYDLRENSGSRSGHARGAPSRPNAAVTPAAAHRGAAAFHSGTPSANNTVGPTDAGVLQAVKILCSELTPQSLDDVRRFIDTLTGQ